MAMTALLHAIEPGGRPEKRDLRCASTKPSPTFSQCAVEFAPEGSNREYNCAVSSYDTDKSSLSPSS